MKWYSLVFKWQSLLILKLCKNALKMRFCRRAKDVFQEKPSFSSSRKTETLSVYSGHSPCVLLIISQCDLAHQQLLVLLWLDCHQTLYPALEGEIASMGNGHLLAKLYKLHVNINTCVGLYLLIYYMLTLTGIICLYSYPQGMNKCYIVFLFKMNA